MPNVFRKKFPAKGLAVLFALMSGPTLADMPITYKDGGRALLHVSVLDFWALRAGGGAPGLDDGRLINWAIGLTPVSEVGVWMGFIPPHEVASYDEALEYLRGVDPFLVENAEVQDCKRIFATACL